MNIYKLHIFILWLFLWIKMCKPQVEIFDQIAGIGAASGLYLHSKNLYLIGDNSSYLNEYNIDTKALKKLPMFSIGQFSSKDNIPKTEKPDFEVLCHYKNELYILGSGSTNKRNLMIQYNLVNQKITHTDLTKLYNQLKLKANINDENFNIEGAIFTGHEWLLFNRGNGKLGINGIFKITGNNLATLGEISFKKIELPKINNVVSSFTDAILYKDTIYFIATAENTSSTYNDGEILGSFIGSMDLATLNLNFTHKISDNQKFEGISFFYEENNKIEFLLCEDRDSEELNTIIYKCSLEL